MKLPLTIAALVALGVGQAYAASYSFTYIDDGIDLASGFLNTTNLGGGVELVVSGSMTVTASSDVVAIGNYNLLANPNPPNVVTSPSGLFLYDDLLYPSQPVGAQLDLDGLLFTRGDGTEVNIWGNGAGVPNSFYVGRNGGYSVANNNGLFTLRPVPEPFTMTLGLASAGLFLRRKVKAKKAS